jgi:hypothetical protein
MVDLGYLFLRPRFHFGYGRPHFTWVGLEVNPLLAGNGIGAYGGLRGEVAWFELRAGARYMFAFEDAFLRPAESYDRITIQDRTTDAPSRYLSLEAQLQLDPDLFDIGDAVRVSLSTEITGTYVMLVDPGLNVFEQTLKVVVAPPWVWSVDLGFRFGFGPDKRIYVQPRVQVVHIVGRDAIVVRAGLQAGFHLWPDLEIRLIAVPAIVSPDSIGAQGGDTFLLGLRYRWATDAAER